MSYARTITAAAIAAIAIALVPQVASGATVGAPDSSAVEVVSAPMPISALPEVEASDVIEGVRIVADTADRIAMATSAVEKFDAAGWPITNTEIRWDQDACNGAVAFHAVERGHHVVVMCNDSYWTMLHELGHVWSALYLDDERRAEWLERRGLESWSDGSYDDRGTEQAAQVIAFGLFDVVHIPSMSNNGYDTLVEDFEWIFGQAPVRS